MSLFGRIALTGAVLFAVAVALVLLIWKPISQTSFVNRTDGLLRDAGSDFGAIATGLVEDTMRFASETSRDTDEQRLPLPCDERASFRACRRAPGVAGICYDDDDADAAAAGRVRCMAAAELAATGDALCPGFADKCTISS